MTENYTKLFSLEENLYTEGSPLVIKSGALYKEKNNGGIVAQLELHSVSDKPIIAVKIEITCFDTMRRVLSEPFIVDYLDFVANRGEDFGSDNVIKLNNPTTRVITAKVHEVGFSDFTIWSPSLSCWKSDVNVSMDSDELLSFNEWKSIGEFKTISDNDSITYELMALKEKFGETSKYLPFFSDTLWGCTCGALNYEGDEKCIKCNSSREDLKNINFDELRKEGIYLTAIELLNFNSDSTINRAFAEFEKIKGYKDSAEKLEKIKARLAAKAEAEKEEKKKKQKKIKLSAIIGGSLAVLALIGYFVLYPLVVIKIEGYKFYIDKFNVEKFTVPDSFTSIGESEFSFCDSLTSVTIPDSVTSIGDYAFSGCENLTSVKIGNGVTSIGEDAFYECESLTSVKIGNGVTTIGEDAFSYCSSLTSITIPDSVTSIGAGAFYHCESLTSITIPDSVTSIGESAFDWCKNLTSVKIGNGVTTIGEDAFSCCESLTSITIPDSVKSVGYGAFSFCDSLTSITIPDSVTSIGDEVFKYCYSLTSITIPDSVTSIGEYVFFSCNNLTDVYYEGTEAEFERIVIGYGNYDFKNATIHYNYNQ